MQLIIPILFLLTAFFCFYVPGSIILSKLKVNNGPLGIVGWIFGSCLFIFLSYLFAWLRIPWMVIIVVVIFSILYFRRFSSNWNLLLKEWGDVDKYSVAILIFGSVTFALVMFFSGWVDGNGIQFRYVNAVDGIRHLAYIKNQVNFFPPQQPGLAGIEVRGFHYFYDFMLSRFSLFFFFAPRDLYFRLFPFLVAFMYGGAFLALSTKITSNLKAQRLILFLAYFSRGLSFLYLFFLGKINLTESVIVQPIGLIINPFTVFSVSFLVVGIYLIPEIKKNWRYAIVVGLIYGILSQIKIYAGLAGVIVLVCYSIYCFVRYRGKFILQVLLLNFIAAVITIITYFPNNLGAGGLILNPFLLMREYMQRAILVDLKWELKRQVFAQDNNYLRIFLLYIQMIAIYFAVNFGIRLIPIVKIRNIFTKRFWINDYNFLLTICIIGLIVLGSLFVQTVSVFDTIQFFWIAIPILSIPTGLLIIEFLEKINNKKISIFLLVIFTITTIPGNMDFLTRYLTQEKGIFVSKEEFDFYQKLKNSTSPKEFLIFLPGKSLLSEKDAEGVGTPLISALTGRSIYWEGGGIPNKYGQKIVEERKHNLLRLDDALTECNISQIKDILKEIGSNVIITENYYSCLQMRFKVQKSTNSKFIFARISL